MIDGGSLGTVVTMRCKVCGWAASGYAVTFTINGLICPCSHPDYCKTVEEVVDRQLVAPLSYQTPGQTQDTQDVE